MNDTDILKEIFSLARNSNYNTSKNKSNDFKQINLEENAYFDNINNIVDLEDKSCKNVLQFFKYKFLKKQFYIFAGQALLSIHPYEQFDITKNDLYKSVQTVVLNAIFNLKNNLGHPDQCLVISGDSGSGKTFSACLAIHYLSQYNNINNNNNYMWQAWSSVPLLAAFGNASTIHNSNSSRFGKLIKMQFDDNKIIGTKLKVYLLEKSRVSGPNRGEGNFHIFNQILENYDIETLKNAFIDKNTIYKIAPKNTIKSNNYLYKETLKSMKTLGIDNLEDILKTLSIILNLGNVNFIETDMGYKISEDTKLYIQNVCKILHCSEIDVLNLLTKRYLAARSKRCTFCYSNCISVEECNERKNTFMRFLYNELFKWIVRKINEKTCSQNIKSNNNICILDLYGFEIFQVNTFEQLCINYANERLHEFFIKNYIENDKENCIPISSNYKERIQTIDGPIFGILNEECLLKRFNSDSAVANRLNNVLNQSKMCKNSTNFVISHYTGIVEYDCKNMLEKNRDKIPDEVFMFLNGCGFTFLQEMVIQKSNNDKNKTLLCKFKKSLDNLLSTLENCDCHFIKCLKPNLQQISGHFDDDIFKSQLNNNGVLDILKVEMQNYPIKLTYENYNKKHSIKNLNILPKIKGSIFCGKEYIYFTYESYQNLKTIENIRRNVKARKILNFMRKFYENKIKSFEGKCKSYKRLYFVKNNVISTRKILEVPYRFHIRKTCIPHITNLPISLLPKGLPDIL